MSQTWQWAHHNSYAFKKCQSVCFYLDVFVFFFDWYPKGCVPFCCTFPGTQIVLQIPWPTLWLWNGSHNQKTIMEHQQEFLLVFFILDSETICSTTIFSCVKAVITNFTIAFIIIKFFFANLAEILLLAWFFLFLCQRQRFPFSLLIISVACSFRFAQNFFIESSSM